MTRLVIGLAVVVVVVLVIVILAARNMRAEDPEDFADRSGSRSQNGSDRRDGDSTDRSVRRPARDGRPGLRQDGPLSRAASSRSDRRHDDKRWVSVPDDRTTDYREPGSGPRPSREGGSRSNDGGRDRDHVREDHAGDHGVAGQGMRPGHHGAGSRGHMARRDRQRGSVPRDRGTDHRDDDAATRRRTEAPASAAARTRQARGNRSDDSADWPSTEWDKLSDVDYWAELTSGKPLTTTAQPAAPARDGQGSHYRDANAGPGPGATGPAGAAGLIPGPEGDAGLPPRSHPQLAAAPVPPAAPVAAAAPVPSPSRPPVAAGYGPDEPTIDQGGAAGRVHRRIQGSLDDDPLTSPSFPRVRADDSRSFRNSRTGGHTSGSPSAPTQQFASYDILTTQFSAPAATGGERGNLLSYPDAAPGPGGNHSGIREARPASTDSYLDGPGSPSRPRSGADPASGSAPLAAGTAPLPSGNPYGSYVGTPPSGGFSARPAQDLNAHRGAPDPPTSDLDGHVSGWYPQHAGSPLTGDDAEGTVPGRVGFETRGPGRHGDGRYYRSGSYPSGSYPSGSYPSGRYPSGSYAARRPGQEIFLPAPGYPSTPAAPTGQDDRYAQDGYGGQSGYEPLGR
jgi:hypothetical protein